MKVTITGASGFLGTRLVEELIKADGPGSIHVLGRRPVAGVRFSEWDSLGEAEPPSEALAGAEAVVHLAGEPVAQRWNAEVKARIVRSREHGTRKLIHALSTMSKRPKVLVSASATGIYGTRKDEVLTETSRAGTGFLADTCQKWEREADMAGALGIRTAQIRIGIVLGRRGGALEQMLPPFKMGVGGKLGSGKQWMSWVHIDDIVNLILFAMRSARVSGAVNGVSPNPVRNVDFTHDLAGVIRLPAVMPVPGFALRALYGEMSEVLLGSQRVIPEAAMEAGFRFAYPDLGPALRDVLTGPGYSKS